MSEPTRFEFVVETSEAAQRLDAFLTSKLASFSRTAIRRAINSGQVAVDGRHRKPSHKLRAEERVAGELTIEAASGPIPEDIPLDIVHEDDQLAVINKPSGMVVHPAKGHWEGTLTSALAFHFQQLSSVGGPQRPGIVHRLDRDTSGLIVVAKSDAAHVALASQFEHRQVEKEYYAICRGQLDRDRDWIRQPIGVHPYQREKMAIRAEHGTSRDAETFYEVDQRWTHFLAFRVFPKTGRTHQIRVHLTHVGCPILCDPLYSGHRILTAADFDRKASANTDEVVLDRLALHARRIRFRHPESDEWLEFEQPIPEELRHVTTFFN